MPEPARRLARAIRYAPERILHPARRRRAHERLEGLDVRSVLAVCYGNICRSPYAAAVLGEAAPRLTVESAGFILPGRPPPEIVIELAARRGLDLSAHRSQVVGPRVGEFDLVVVMEPYQADWIERDHGVERDRLLVLGDLDPSRRLARRAILDPYGRPPGEFERVFARIDACLGALIGITGLPDDSGASP